MSIGQSFDDWNQSSTDEPPAVVLACGPEDQLREEIVQSLTDSLPETAETLTLYADEQDPDEAVRELRSPGLFTDQRLVRLRNLHRRSGGNRPLTSYLDPLQSYLDDPEPGVTMVLEDADHPYKSGRKVGSLARAVEDAGGDVVICWELFDRDLQARLRKRLDELGVDYDPAAIPVLIQRVEGKFSRALQEVKKLADRTDRVDVEDVQAVISREAAGESLQAFQDALLNDPLPQVMQRLDDLFRENESPARVAYVLVDHLTGLRSLKKSLRGNQSLKQALQDQGIPTSKGIMDQYRRDLNQLRSQFPQDFYRHAYRLIQHTRYRSPSVSRRSLEAFLTRMIPRLRQS